MYRIEKLVILISGSKLVLLSVFLRVTFKVISHQYTIGEVWLSIQYIKSPITTWWPPIRDSNHQWMFFGVLFHMFGNFHGDMIDMLYLLLWLTIGFLLLRLTVCFNFLFRLVNINDMRIFSKRALLDKSVNCIIKWVTKWFIPFQWVPYEDTCLNLIIWKVLFWL